MGRMLQRLIGEDVELRIRPAPGLGHVRADPSQLEQVVMNLAVNARDAMPGGGRLTIETADVELDERYAREHMAVAPGPYVRLAVSDTGSGMTPEVRARIFEPFFTTKERGKGTGLGLSTVYGIVKQSGGYIWVYSEPGVGTTFKIYLPRVSAPCDAAETAAGPRAARGSETVLLVEDEPTVRSLAQKVLERHGYRVLSARNSADAVRLATGRPQPIPLLLTDVVMPGGSGPALAERLRADWPELRVLFMSGYTEYAAERAALVGPGSGFLEKPFLPDALARKVREMLDDGPLPAAV
jgi:CheY-like chemotaxis protein